MSKFKDMKFRVSGPEQSKALQEVLFEQGYKWDAPEVSTVKHTRKQFLFTYTDCSITYADDVEHFQDHQHWEHDSAAYINAWGKKDFSGLEEAYNDKNEPLEEFVRPASEIWSVFPEVAAHKPVGVPKEQVDSANKIIDLFEVVTGHKLTRKNYNTLLTLKKLVLQHK